MSRLNWIVVWFTMMALLLTLNMVACGDDDDDDDGTESMLAEGEQCYDSSAICGDKGDLPVQDGTMVGQFDFSGTYCFSFFFLLSAEDLFWSATLSLHDANQHLQGPCSGIWDENGFVTGQCRITGESDGIEIDVFLDGEIGNNAACGTWYNDADQNGTWWAQRD